MPSTSLCLRIAAVASLLFAAGCIRVHWVELDDTSLESNQPAPFSMDVPLDWMRNIHRPEIVVTREGPEVQWIVARGYPLGTPLPQTRQPPRRDMSPSELMELHLAELRRSAWVRSPELVEQTVVEWSGRQGYRLHLRYRAPNDVQYELLNYGFAVHTALYVLQLHTPSLYYFERDLPAFERARDTFRTAAER